MVSPIQSHVCRFIGLVALGIAVCLPATAARGADYAWNPLQSDPGPSDGSGTWDTTTTNWWDAVGSANVAWPNLTIDTAIFGNGGTAGAVTLSGSLTTGGLSFLSVSSGAYGFTGSGTLALASGGTITFADGATTSGRRVAFNAGLSGENIAVRKAGGTLDQWLDLNVANAFTGTFTVGGANGAIAVLASSNMAFGTANVIVEGGGFVDVRNAGLTLANNFTIAGSGVGNRGAIRFFAANQTLSGTIALAGDAVFGMEQSGTISGAVSGGFGISADRTGTLTLAGANSYTGRTSIPNGGIRLTGSLSPQTDLLLGSGASSGRFILGGSGGAVNQTVAGLATSGTGTANAVVGGNAAVSTLTVNLASGTSTFAGTLGGSGTNENAFAFVKDGGGTFVLAGANTYAGATTISGGTLQVGAGGTAGSLGTAASDIAVASGATLAFNRLDSYGGPVTRAITGSGGLRLDAGLLSLSGANTYSGGTAVNGGVLAWLSPVAQPASGTATVANGAGLALGVGSGLYSVADFESLHAGSLPNVSLGATSLAGVDTSAGDVAIATALGGTRGVVKTGLGTLALSGASTYSGPTTIRGGTLAVATLANGGVASPLGGSSADAANLVLGGGALRYTGATTASDRGFTLLAGSTGTIDVATGGTVLTLSGGTPATTGGLTKAGPGTLVLAGTQAHTGGTTIAAGTLQVGAGGDGGSIAGAITNDATLVFDRSTSLTHAGVISGVGTLVKRGAGGLTLTGSSPYTGSTIVELGNVRLSNRLTGTAAVTMGGGGTFFNGSDTTSQNNNIADRINPAATLTLTGGPTTPTTFQQVAPATGTHSQALAGIVVGPGPTAINTSASVASSIVQLTGPSATAYSRDSAGNLIVSSVANLAVRFTNLPTQMAGAGADAILPGASWSNTDFLTLTGSGPYTAAAATYTASGTTTWTAGKNMNVTESVTAAGPTDVNSIRFGGAHTVTLAGTNVIGSGMVMNPSTGSTPTLTGGTITSGYVNGGTAELMVIDRRSGAINRSTSPVSIDSVIADNGATPVKVSVFGSATTLTGTAGFGNVKLGGVNTHTGGTQLVGGEILFNADSAFGAVPAAADAANIRVASSGWLRALAATTIHANRGIEITSGTLTLDGVPATLTVAGSISGTGTVSTPVNSGGLVILTGTNTFTGTVEINNGGIRADDGVGLSPNANLRFGSNDGTLGGFLETQGSFTRPLGTGAGEVQWNGAVFVAGIYTPYYSGGFSAVGGPLTVALGGVGSPQTFTWNDTTVKSTTKLNLQSTNATDPLTWLNPVDLAAGTRTVQVASTTQPATLAGVISNGSLTKAGAGVLALSAANTYTGSTTVSAGTLQIGAGGTTGSLATGSAVSVVSPGSLGFNRSDDYGGAFANAISGSGGVIVSAGTVTFAKAHTYTGATTILGGTLAVSNSAALGTSAGGAFIVAPGRLDVSGGITVANAVFLNGAADGPTATRIVNSAATNTLSADISLNTGGLVYGLEAAAGTLTVAGSIKRGNATADRTLALRGAATGEVTGVINGSGFTLGIVKEDAGTWTLTAANTHTGPTSVTGGTLVLGNALALQNSALETAGAGSVQLGAGITTPTFGGLSGGVDLATRITAGYGSVSGLTLNVTSGTTSYSGAIADGAAGTTLAKSGAGTQELSGANTYTGLTTVTNGRLRIASAGGLGGTAAGTKVVGLGTANVMGLELAAGVTVAGEALELDGGAGRATLFLNDNSTWAGDIAFTNGTSYNAIQIAGTGIAITGTISASGTYSGGSLGVGLRGAGEATVSGPITAGSNTVEFGRDGGTWILTNSANTLGSASIQSGTLRIGGAGQLNGGSYAGTIVNRSRFEYFSSADQTISGVISDAGTLVKDGASTLTLAAANTYTGATTVSAGTLATSVAEAIADTSAVSVAAGARFALGGNERVASIAGAGTFDLGSHALTAGNSTSTTVDGTITGSGGLTKLGTGILTLTAANPGFTGATTISAGAIEIASGSALGGTASGTTVASGASLRLRDGITLAEPLTLSGDGLDNNGSLQNVSGANVVSGPVALAAAAQIGVTAGSLALSDPAGITGTGTNLTFVGAGDLTIAGPLAIGGGSLLMAGSGVTTLSAASTYSGGSSITAGTVAVGDDAAFGTGSFNLGNGVLRSATAAPRTITNPIVYSVDMTFGSADTGNLLFTGDVNAGSLAKTFTVANAITDFSGVISGGGGRTKAGPGTLIFSGQNTYTGATTVSAGTLLVNGALLSTSSMTVSAGATLGGSGRIATTIAGAGLVSPGNSPGITTANAVNPTAGTSYAFEFTALGSPNYGNAAASINDVLRLTAATPFTASLTGGNLIDVYFDLASLGGGDTFRGGFYTDTGSDFLSSIGNATYAYWVRGDGSGSDRTFNGQSYYSLGSFSPALSVTLSTVAETADFGAGPVSGQVTQFVVVPEPAGPVLVVVATSVGVALLRRRRHAGA